MDNWTDNSKPGCGSRVGAPNRFAFAILFLWKFFTSDDFIYNWYPNETRKKIMKIMISGGHLTPALAFIDYVQKINSSKREEIIFVGRVFSQDKLKQKALEKQEIQKRIKSYPGAKIKFIPFEASRFASSSFVEKVKSIILFIKSFVLAQRIVKKQKPDVFLSFGGYLAVPISIACWLQKIPIVTHEQTRIFGMANQIIAKFATKVAISYETSAKEFPLGKVMLTGNPVRAKVLDLKATRPEWLPARLTKSLLLVMGGNQGSQIINQTLADSLKFLLADWVIVHQCGKATQENDYFAQLSHARENIDESLRNNYIIREWISESELAWLYKNAFGAISRAGANTVQELALVGLPSIFIPLPFAYKNEQFINAQWLVQEGGAVLLGQEKLSPNSLRDALVQLKQFNEMMRKNLKRLKIEKKADKKLYDLLVGVVNGKK